MSLDGVEKGRGKEGKRKQKNKPCLQVLTHEEEHRWLVMDRKEQKNVVAVRAEQMTQ